MIIPPPDVKNLILKTVSFVIKNGREFEEKLKAKESSNPKFSFLLFNDPYHPYYERAVESLEFLSGIYM